MADDSFIADPETDEGLPETQDWRAGLDEELRVSPALKDINDVASLARNFVDQQAYLGNAIRPPGPDASDEQRQAFYAKLQEHAPQLIPRPDPEDAEAMAALKDALGRPGSADDYTLPEVEGLDPEDFKAAAPLFHELGLTQDQAAALVAYQIEQNGKAVSDHRASITEQQAELQREWGVTFEPRIGKIKKFAEQTGAPEELVAALGSNEINGPTLRWLHGLVEAVGSEGMNVATDPGGASDVMPPAEALARVNEITERMANMFPSHPEYQGLVKKRMEYLRMAHPGADESIDGLRAGQSGPLDLAQ